MDCLQISYIIGVLRTDEDLCAPLASTPGCLLQLVDNALLHFPIAECIGAVGRNLVEVLLRVEVVSVVTAIEIIECTVHLSECFFIHRNALPGQHNAEVNSAGVNPPYSAAGSTAEKDSPGDSPRRAPNIGKSLNISVNGVRSGPVTVHLCQDRSPFTVEQWKKLICQFWVVKGEIGGHNQWGGILSEV